MASLVLVVAILLSGCGGPSDIPQQGTGAPASLSRPPSAATVAFRVSITTSRYGSVNAVTTPGASCTAQAVLPSGRVSTAQGLQATQSANSSGVVSWTYGTASNTTRGTGTHTVTCRYQGQTQSMTALFQVQ